MTTALAALFYFAASGGIITYGLHRALRRSVSGLLIRLEGVDDIASPATVVWQGRY